MKSLHLSSRVLNENIFQEIAGNENMRGILVDELLIGLLKF